MMSKARATNQFSLDRRPSKLVAYAVFAFLCAAQIAGVRAFAQDVKQGVEEGLASSRQGYLVNVELPLIGDRDEQIVRQIKSIADSNANLERSPIVVLRFVAAPLADLGGEPNNGGMGTRGSQFERSLALARFLTTPDASRVRLVAYLPETVEGHAVLPVLACGEIFAASHAELGRAAIDEAADEAVKSLYLDVVRRRAALPDSVVLAMLDPAMEVYQVELSDGSSQTASREELLQLRTQGLVLKEETIWQGGGLASFSGQQMRARRWIERTVADEAELGNALGLTTTLRSAKQLPREWHPIGVTLSGSLDNSRVNQIIRGLDEQFRDGSVNLVVFTIQPTQCKFQHAARLAAYIADLNSDKVYTLGIVTEPISGPTNLIAIACRETALLTGASMKPSESVSEHVRDSDSMQRTLGDLAVSSNRPLPLVSVLVDPDVEVQEFIHQQTGKRTIFADWQIAQQADAQLWLAKRIVAGKGVIDADVALRYRLIDSIDDSVTIARARIGLDEAPPELKTPWLDASIQMLLSQGWLPRILLTIGFFAMMAELGNPGIGAGAFISGLCFLGFFWIEGLNGNVEWLEILLFVAGLVALAFEIFVVPGFGLFGIGGLLMVLVSVVLASQTFIWPTTSAELNEVAVNLFWVACLALGGMVGLLFMHKQLERLPMLKWVTLLPDDADDIHFRESLTHREHLLGQEGLTITRLNPSGKAQFGRDIVSVVGTGKLISEGVAVRVVEVRGNLVLVEELA